jgi:hypothetical protein
VTRARGSSSKSWSIRQVSYDGLLPPHNTYGKSSPANYSDKTGLAADSGDAGDLTGDVLSNFTRFLKGLPSGAGEARVTQMADGSVQFSADLAATNIPGSYATYTKVVGPDGVTTTFYKTTIAPDGSVVSVKVKYP